jgi:NAD-dependent DNA ligase
MSGEKAARILRTKSNLSEEEISSMSDKEAWDWIYAHKKIDPDKGKSEICFTGFRPEDKYSLMAYAAKNGMKVVKSVTIGLRYLCIGSDPGPVKMEMAEFQGVNIITEE